MTDSLEKTGPSESVTQSALLDDDLKAAEMLNGIDAPRRYGEFLSEATNDAIRNFAMCYGDDNPLYADEDYARHTRWGGKIAPGIMAAVIGKPMLGEPIPRDVREATKGLFKGLHGFVSGSKWEWYRPIHVGDTLYTFVGQESVEVKESEFSGRSVIRVRREVKFNQNADVVAVYRTVFISAPRKTAKSRGKYDKIEKASYEPERIAEIDKLYLAESARGGQTRYFEDVAVGDVLGPRLKGPLTTTELFAFHAGGYGWNYADGRPAASRIAAKDRAAAPHTYHPNESGVPDHILRAHFDDDWARGVGVPMAYDYGVQRECWMHHAVTDWMGDDAIILAQDDTMSRFNFVGDLQTMRGKVIDKQPGSKPTVRVEVICESQRGEETARGDFVVALPSKDRGPAVYPEPSDDLKRKAIEMFERHNKLTGLKA